MNKQNTAAGYLLSRFSYATRLEVILSHRTTFILYTCSTAESQYFCLLVLQCIMMMMMMT